MYDLWYCWSSYHGRQCRRHWILQWVIQFWSLWHKAVFFLRFCLLTLIVLQWGRECWLQIPLHDCNLWRLWSVNVFKLVSIIIVCDTIKPNTHSRRSSTVELSCVCRVYWVWCSSKQRGRTLRWRWLTMTTDRDVIVSDSLYLSLFVFVRLCLSVCRCAEPIVVNRWCVFCVTTDS